MYEPADLTNSEQVVRNSTEFGAGYPKTHEKMGGFPEQGGLVSAVKGATYPRHTPPSTTPAEAVADLRGAW